MNRLKYANYYIGYQEVPNEITLCINISDCPYKCEGCHSQYLWDHIGEYILDDIDKVLKKYDGLLTCVCFMGGNQNIEELLTLLTEIKDTYGLKTCVYSGSNNIGEFNDVIPYLDYLKIGEYKSNLGGLSSNNTNQKFYKINNSELVDITNVFYKNTKQ